MFYKEKSTKKIYWWFWLILDLFLFVLKNEKCVGFIELILLCESKKYNCLKKKMDKEKDFFIKSDKNFYI